MSEKQFNFETDKEQQDYLDEQVLRFLNASSKPMSSLALGILCDRKISEVKKVLTKLQKQGRVRKATTANVCFWKLAEPKSEQIKNFHRPAREV